MIDLEAIRENSGLTLSADGVFLLHGVPVENPKVQELFSKGLEVRDDGRTLLRVGAQWCYVAPEDTSIIVVGVTESAGAVVVRLNDYTRETLAADTLVLSLQGVLYARVKGKSVLARFGRNAYHQMITTWCSVEEDDSGEFRMVWKNTGVFLPIIDRTQTAEVVV